MHVSGARWCSFHINLTNYSHYTDRLIFGEIHSLIRWARAGPGRGICRLSKRCETSIGPKPVTRCRSHLIRCISFRYVCILHLLRYTCTGKYRSRQMSFVQCVSKCVGNPEWLSLNRARPMCRVFNDQVVFWIVRKQNRSIFFK